MRRILALVIVIVAMAAACSDDERGSDAAPAATATQTAAAATATEPTLAQAAERYLEIARPANVAARRAQAAYDEAAQTRDDSAAAAALRGWADATAEAQRKLIRADFPTALDGPIAALTTATGREVAAVEAVADALEDGRPPGDTLMSELRQAVADHETAAQTVRARLGLPPVPS